MTIYVQTHKNEILAEVNIHYKKIDDVFSVEVIPVINIKNYTHFLFAIDELTVASETEKLVFDFDYIANLHQWFENVYLPTQQRVTVTSVANAIQKEVLLPIVKRQGLKISIKK